MRSIARCRFDPRRRRQGLTGGLDMASLQDKREAARAAAKAAAIKAAMDKAEDRRKGKTNG